MSTVQPPPPSPISPSASGAATLPVLTVSTPPPALTSLPLGTSLNALVTQATARGQARIETPLGTFLVNTKVPLKIGQPLVLQIAPIQEPNTAGVTAQGKGALTLNVLEIAGKRISPGPQVAQGTLSAGGQISHPGLTTSNVGIPASVAPSVTLLVGSTLNGTLLSTVSLPTNAQTTAQPSVLASGNAPTPTPSVPPGITTPGVNSPGAQTTPSSGAIGNTGGTMPLSGSAGGEMRVFPAGSQFSFTIQSVTPAPVSDSPSPASAPFALEAVITGRVSGHTPSGQPVIQTPHGSISLNTSQGLPLGTELSIKIETLPELTQQARPLSTTIQRTGLLMSGVWPSLDEGLAVVQGADPVTAQQINTVSIPKADIKLTATALFFLSALRAGDVRGWIGDNATRLLERLRPDVLQKLGSDFRALGDATDDAGATRRTNEWRGTLIPFMNNGAIEPIRLFTRHIGDEENTEESGDNGTRFLVDISLTNIGRFQLDGMVVTSEKRLDMIVRTSAALPGQVRNDLMALFTNANEVVGMRGGMVFQAAPDGFVEPLEELPPISEEGLGIIV